MIFILHTPTNPATLSRMIHSFLIELFKSSAERSIFLHIAIYITEKVDIAKSVYFPISRSPNVVPRHLSVM